SAGGRYISYCPSSWSYYKLNCFKYFRDLQTWDEAERQCQAIQDGAHLAWVEEHQEAVVLRNTISYYQRVRSVWLGLRYSEENQAWQWIRGDKYNVNSGISGNGAKGGNCSILTHQSSFSRWSSADCTQKHHYICKFTP
ncbi:REG4 protein, partial [Calyptomena viridis]|nr:REG4 protein [Calyptomena viridis]